MKIELMDVYNKYAMVESCIGLLSSIQSIWLASDF